MDLIQSFLIVPQLLHFQMGTFIPCYFMLQVLLLVLFLIGVHSKERIWNRIWNMYWGSLNFEIVNDHNNFWSWTVFCIMKRTWAVKPCNLKCCVRMWSCLRVESWSLISIFHLMTSRLAWEMCLWGLSRLH